MSHQPICGVARATPVAVQALLLACLLLLVAACGSTPRATGASPRAPGERVGTYDGRAAVRQGASIDAAVGAQIGNAVTYVHW